MYEHYWLGWLLGFCMALFVIGLSILIYVTYEISNLDLDVI